MLLQLLTSKCDIVATLPSLRHCVVLLEEGNSCASTFTHHTYGYNAMLHWYRKKRLEYMACCNTTLCCYRRKETCAPNMFLQCGMFGVLLHLIEGDLHTFIVVMRCCVERDCWTNNTPPCHTNNPPRWRRLMCLVDTCTYNHPAFPTSTQQTKGKIFFVFLWFFTSWKHSSCVCVCVTHTL